MNFFGATHILLYGVACKSMRLLFSVVDKPQSWIHNCEVGNRRIDVTEFAARATACGVKPTIALGRFLRQNG